MPNGFEPETIARLKGMVLTEDEIRWLIENYRGADWLELQLTSYLRAGRISQEQAATIFDTVLLSVPTWEREVSAWGKEQETLAREREEALTQRAVQDYRDRLKLAGMRRPGEYRSREDWERPPMPGTEKAAKAFLEETGLGKGTRLRSFLEQEFLPEIMRETRGAREAWWARMHPEPEEKDDLGREKRRLQEEAGKWANIAWGGGESGLKDIAEQAYRHAVGELGEIIPEIEAGKAERAKFPRLAAPSPGEDPLKAALRRKDFLAKYYQRPKTGLAGALTPAVRY